MSEAQIPNKETTLCISLAARPSNHGTRFHNYLYRHYGLNYLYKAFAPFDLAQAIRGVRGLGIRGCAISMPYKEAVIALVDQLDDSAEAIGSVNTIVNNDGVLRAYNTDYVAVARLLEEGGIGADASVLVRGAGGMAKAVVAALAGRGCTQVTVVSRDAERAAALAEAYGYTSVPEDSLWPPAQVLINVTPLGMSGQFEDELAFAPEMIAAAQTVFDVVAMPELTPLIRAAQEAHKQVITGAQVSAIQAAEQFVLYTGVRPTPELVRAASHYARSAA